MGMCQQINFVFLSNTHSIHTRRQSTKTIPAMEITNTSNKINLDDRDDSGYTTDNTWFREKEVMWPGQSMSLRVKELIHEEKSLFQHIQIFESQTYGRVLVLDGVIQLTERDEFSYQESLVHTSLFSHPNPKRVLLIGGGDGGMLREICKHPGVEEIVMVEIDESVVNVSKTYFADTMATAFTDPRVTLIIGDGAKYVQEHAGDNFDALLVDSSDPVGPASVLFENTFYTNCSKTLGPGGIMCNQGECVWLHLDIIKPVLDHCRKCFAESGYFYCTVPTYPSGQIGFILARKEGKDSELPPLGEPTRIIDAEMQIQMRYYNEKMHRASFVLPEFAQRALSTKSKVPSSSASVYRLNVILRIKPDRREDFLACILANQQGTMENEPLALSYVFGEDDESTNTFHFAESYKGKEGFEAHCASPHFAAWEEFVNTDPFTQAPEVYKFVTM